MTNASLAVKIIKSVEHLVQEQTTRVLAEALTTRVLYEVKHVEEVASKILSDHVDVRVVLVSCSLDMHDSLEIMAHHVNEVLVVEVRMIFNLFLYLLFV